MPADRSWCLIRQATPGEIPQIESVTAAAYTRFRNDVPAAIFKTYMDDMRQFAARWDDTQVLVAELDGRIAASVSFYADASADGLRLPGAWAGSRYLAVHPDVQGRGIGTKLTHACIGAAVAQGAPAVGIHTVSFMRAACKLYERLGFRRCPAFDLQASEMLSVDGAEGDLAVVAYRLDLPSTDRRGFNRGDRQTGETARHIQA